MRFLLGQQWLLMSTSTGTHEERSTVDVMARLGHVSGIRCEVVSKRGAEPYSPEDAASMRWLTTSRPRERRDPGVSA